MRLISYISSEVNIQILAALLLIYQYPTLMYLRNLHQTSG